MSIHLTSESMCSGCLQQRPEDAHVDFDVQWDGPSFTNEDGYPHNQIDDLILCRACLARAVELLSLEPEVQSALEREVDELKAEVSEWRDYAQRIEDTVPRRPGRPRKTELQGVA